MATTSPFAHLPEWQASTRRIDALKAALREEIKWRKEVERRHRAQESAEKGRQTKPSSTSAAEPSGTEPKPDASGPTWGSETAKNTTEGDADRTAGNADSEIESVAVSAAASTPSKRKPEDSLADAQCQREVKKAKVVEDGASALPSPPTSSPARKRKVDSSGEGESEAPRSPKRVCQPRPQPRGLANPQVSCYANAALQFLDEALNEDDFKELEAGGAELEMFGLSDSDCVTISTEGWRRRQNHGKVAQLRACLEKRADESDILIAPYLAKTLRGIRSDAGGSGTASAFMLQQVFAYSGAPELRKFNGDSQEDAGEYLGKLIDRIIEEVPVLGRRFTARLQSTIRRSECGHAHSVGDGCQERLLHVGCSPEVTGNGTESDASILLSKNLTQELADYRCSADPCAKTNTSSMVKIFEEVPDNLILLVSRATAGRKKNSARLNISLEEPVVIKSMRYQITALIKHTGRSANCGHYKAYRKGSGNWIELDDAKVSTAKDVRDGVGGHITALLLQKLEA